MHSIDWEAILDSLSSYTCLVHFLWLWRLRTRKGRWLGHHEIAGWGKGPGSLIPRTELCYSQCQCGYAVGKPCLILERRTTWNIQCLHILGSEEGWNSELSPTLGSHSPFISPMTLLSNFLLKNPHRASLAELSKMRGERAERQEENGLPLIMSVQSWGLQLRIKSHLGIIQQAGEGKTHKHTGTCTRRHTQHKQIA